VNGHAARVFSDRLIRPFLLAQGRPNPAQISALTSRPIAGSATDAAEQYSIVIAANRVVTGIQGSDALTSFLLVGWAPLTHGTSVVTSYVVAFGIEYLGQPRYSVSVSSKSTDCLIRIEHQSQVLINRNIRIASLGRGRFQCAP
jgi:hypothetical protein